MDMTKFFEPVRKFTTYLVDRFSLILITYFLVSYMINESIFEHARRYATYPMPSGYLDGLGIKGDNQSVVVAVVGLLFLVAILEIHERILQLLNMFSPVTFSTHSYYGEDAFYGFAPLVWRGYCRKLDLGELKNLFQITSTKLQLESQPRTRRAEVFDLVPAWIFLLLLLYIFSPQAMLAISIFGFLKIGLILLLIGFVWELYRARDYSAEASRFHYLAIAALLEKKAHEFEELSAEQKKQLEERRKSHQRYAQPWRIPVIRSPWFSFIRDAISFIRSRIEIRSIQRLNKSRGG